MTHELINIERKTGGNFTFLNTIFDVGDNREYRVIETIVYEGDKKVFVDYTVNTQNSDLPEINYNHDKDCFAITASYTPNNMTPDEFKKFLEDQQKGLEVASFLTRAFCNSH